MDHTASNSLPPPSLPIQQSPTSQLPFPDSSDLCRAKDGEYVSAQTEPPTLCIHCQGFLVLLQGEKSWSQECMSKESWPIPHYNYDNDLDLSAKMGCRLCYQLRQSITSNNSLNPTFSSDIARLFFMQEDETWSLHVSCEFSGKYKVYRNYSARLYPILHSTATLRSNPLNKVQTTKEALPLAKYWLQTCSKEHSVCNFSSTQKSRVLPTRLLDLTGVNPKLVSNTSLNNSVKYGTLSHCWGKIALITLRKNSLAQFFTEITYGELPQTFKDAMYVARYLGLDYLWIDSLCIIQDDGDDWKRESALMASVYGNSSLTIAASGAADARVGLFFERKPSWRLRLRAEFGDSEQFYEYLPELFRVSELFDEQPLLYRAWVLQERVLSPRTLQFTTNELFWECAEMKVSERFPNANPQPPPYVHGELLTKPPFTLDTWQSLVTFYSKCKLTYGKDKLVAISGLAQASQLGAQQRYIAGLWEDNIEQQLCWSTDYGYGSRYLGYRAPSWSWASVDGEIWFMPNRENPLLLVKVQEIKVQLEREDEPYGEIRNASIDILCTYLLHGDMSDDKSMSWNFDARRTVYDGNPKADYEDFYLLPMANEPSELGIRTFFLILLPTGYQPGQYVRVGDWRVTDLDGKLKTMFDGRLAPAGVEDYVEVFVDKTANGKPCTGLIELV